MIYSCNLLVSLVVWKFVLMRLTSDPHRNQCFGGKLLQVWIWPSAAASDIQAQHILNFCVCKAACFLTLVEF